MTSPTLASHRLGRSDVTVTALGLGCAPLGNLYGAIDDTTARATIDAAWEHGVRLLDTAPHYGLGLSERRVGAALHDRPRDEVVVSTKVGRLLELIEAPHPAQRDDQGFDVPATHRRRWDFSATGVRRSLEASLERLQLTRVDIVLLHDPDDHLWPAVNDAYPALRAMRDDGVIGAIGAGMNAAEPLRQLVEAVELDVVVVAGRYTLLDQGALDGLLPTCRRRGTSVLAAGVFNSGILASDHPRGDARYDYAPAPAKVMARAQVLAAVCDRYGATLPQVALHLPLAHPDIAGLLVGARLPEEVQRNAELLARPVPPALWPALIHAGLVRADTPIPV